MAGQPQLYAPQQMTPILTQQQAEAQQNALSGQAQQLAAGDIKNQVDQLGLDYTKATQPLMLDALRQATAPDGTTPGQQPTGNAFTPSTAAAFPGTAPAPAATASGGAADPNAAPTSNGPLAPGTSLFTGPMPLSADQGTQKLVGQKALAMGLNPEWAMRVHYVESGASRTPFGPGSTSPAGAIGPMQLMPATAADPSINPGGKLDPYKLEDNIELGLRYMAQMKTRYGSPVLATGAYNGGPGRMDSFLAGKGSLPSETLGYVGSVFGNNDGTGLLHAAMSGDHGHPIPLPGTGQPSATSPTGLVGASYHYPTGGLQEMPQDAGAQAATMKLLAEKRYYMLLPNGSGARAAAAIQTQLDNIAGPGGIVDPRTGRVLQVPGATATRFASSQATEAGKVGPQTMLAANKGLIDERTHAANSAVDTAAAAQRPMTLKPGDRLVTPNAVGVGGGGAPPVPGLPPMSAPPTLPPGAASTPPGLTVQPGQPGVVAMASSSAPPALQLPASGVSGGPAGSAAASTPNTAGGNPAAPTPSLADLALNPGGGTPNWQPTRLAAPDAAPGITVAPASPGGAYAQPSSLSALGSVPALPTPGSLGYTMAMRNAVSLDSDAQAQGLPTGTFYRVGNGPLQVHDPLAGKVPQVDAAGDTASMQPGIAQVGGQYVQKAPGSPAIDVGGQENPSVALRRLMTTATPDNVLQGAMDRLRAARPDMNPLYGLASAGGPAPTTPNQLAGLGMATPVAARPPADARFPPAAAASPQPPPVLPGAARPAAPMVPQASPAAPPAAAAPQAPAAPSGDLPGTYTVPYTGEREGADAEAKRLVDVQKPILDQARESQTAMNRIGQARMAVSQMTAGGIPPGYFSPQLAQAAAAAKSLGIDLSTLGIDPKAIGNAQVAQEATTQIMGEMLKRIFPTRVTDADVRVFGEKMLHTGMDPDAINSVLNLAQEGAQWDLNRAHSMLDYKAQHGGRLDQGWEAQFAKQHGFGPDLFNAGAAGTVPSGPGGAGQAGGGGQAAVAPAPLPTVTQNGRIVPDASKLQDGQVYTTPRGRLRFNEARMTFSEVP